ncbi:WG repeat-containing protein [uncultured Campylobacter sp.]|uniref:WG repeat-containing protein n=1 Tax=uncultured Campylobacter sp. TaxID=218934 RepID=UPI002639ED8B|nr:WG repeat-containing protein [uncultured Campylobacter sp.]
MKKILAVLLLGLLGLEAKIIGQGELADYGLVFADGNAVDKDGNIKAVGKNFMVTGTFSDGLCVVFIGEQIFFMDENGRFTVRLAPGMDFKTSFTEGLAGIAKNGKFGFIDKTGRVVVEPKFDDMGIAFKDGAILVGEMKCGRMKYGYVDKSGRTIIPPRYDEATYFSEGLASVRIADKWSVIDKSGATVSKLNLGRPVTFKEGLAPVKFNGLYGFVNKDASVVIEPKFELASLFSEGLAAVKSGGKWGFIDKSGNFAIEPRFDEVNKFKEKRAVVRVGELWGIIDKSGKFILEPQKFDYIFGEFYGGMLNFRVNRKSGCLDIDGKVAIEPIFDDISVFEGDVTTASVDYKSVFIDKKGRILPISYYFEIED